MADRSVPILIIGAGPCGLGAAYRLHEQGRVDFAIVEASNFPGGLATSYVDEHGFTWDVGGHVVHSHYDYFDKVFHRALKNNTYVHQRESWVWLLKRFVPYPFQNNLRYLPTQVMWDCIQGLLHIGKYQKAMPKNFKEWILASFGEGIAKHFLFPYNLKVWSHPLEKMTTAWVGDRVATVNIEKALTNIVFEKDDVAWGPNHVFYFPKAGGTGTVWHSIAAMIPAERFIYNTKVVAIEVAAKKATLSNGDVIRYQHLVSTMPLDALVKISSFKKARPVALSPSKIKQICTSSTVHVVGVGLEGKPHKKLTTKCWMYFPESNVPFFRVTVFSNYSPANVPNPTKQWSLMCEVSESAYQPLFSEADLSRRSSKKLITAVLKGLKTAQLITDKDKVVSTWTHTAPLAYPTPTLARDKYLNAALKKLDKFKIYSRGRFGAWKYEVSNMDHTFMQGVEVVNRIMTGKAAAEITVWHPNEVNHR